MERYAENHEKIMKARRFVKKIKPVTLFLILMMPFTPSSFMNFAFGVSVYSKRRYLLTLYCAKVAMIVLLALIGQSLVLSLDEPLFIITAIAMIAILIYLSKHVFRIDDEPEK
jgi:uncharacterized membrane protein YdjX (TVP38/TMEM64 family)